jgi:hypothetical protein
MILRLIAGIIGAVAGIASVGYALAGRWVPSGLLGFVALACESVAFAALPKGETGRSLPRDDHFDRSNRDRTA